MCPLLLAGRSSLLLTETGWGERRVTAVAVHTTRNAQQMQRQAERTQAGGRGNGLRTEQEKAVLSWQP